MEEVVKVESVEKEVEFKIPEGYVKAPSMKDWLVTLLLLAIPFVNIVMLCIWAFGSGEDTNKKNFSKAYLIITAISVAIVVGIYIFTFIVVFGILSATGY